ncbi:MAG: bacterial Ig-like domain-containing protein, partial [Angelakisella sp.]
NETLTADTSALKDSNGTAFSSFTYQWKNAGTDIASATNSTYTVAEADLGNAITVEVTPSTTNYSAKTSVAVTPAKAASSIAFTEASLDKTYDGSAMTEPVQTTNYTTTGSTGTVTFEWYQSTTKLTSAPTNVGSYTVKALLAADSTHEAATSDAKAFSITTKAITPTIEAISNQTYTGSALEPALTVKDGGTTLTLNTDYTVIYSNNINAGTGKAKVTLKGNYSGSAEATFTINKAAGLAISSVSGSYTGDGTNFTYTIASISGAEYSKDNSAWQDSNVFTGFAVGNTITFYARMKADSNHFAGAAKSTDAVTFAKLSQTAPTPNYTVTGATGSKKITITEVAGAEYSFDGTTFGAINEKTFSTDSTQTIAIRMKATATHLASSAATASVNLANQEQAAPAAFTLKFTINGDQQTFTATIPTVADGEYSFDGVTYGDSNTKTDCQSGSDYTGYVRLKAKAGYNASPATSDTKKAPKVLSGIAITTPPVKTSYTEGDSFDQTGMKVTTTYADSSTTEISGYTVSPSGNLAAGTTQVTVTFTEGGITKTATQTITVASKPSGGGSTGGSGGSSGGGSGSGGGGSSSGGTVTPPPTTITPTNPNPPTTGEINAPATVDNNGNASITVTDQTVADAIKKAQDEAKKNGTE